MILLSVATFAHQQIVQLPMAQQVLFRVFTVMNRRAPIFRNSAATQRLGATMPVFFPDSSSNAASAANEGMSTLSAAHFRRQSIARRQLESAIISAESQSTSRTKDRQRRADPELPENRHADFASVLIRASELGILNDSGMLSGNAEQSIEPDLATDSTAGRSGEGSVAGKPSVVGTTVYPPVTSAQDLMLQHSTSVAQMRKTSEAGTAAFEGTQILPQEVGAEVKGTSLPQVLSAGSKPEAGALTEANTKAEDSGDIIIERTAQWSDDMSLESEAESSVDVPIAAGNSSDGNADLEVGDTTNRISDLHDAGNAEFEVDGTVLGTRINADGSPDVRSSFHTGMPSITGNPSNVLTDGFSAGLSMPLSSQLSTAVVLLLRNEAASRDSSMTVRLDPPELGELTIHLSRSDDGIAVRVTAREPVTMDMLLARGEEIQDRLRGQDIDLSGIEFFRSEFTDDGFPGQSEQRDADQLRTTSRSGRRVKRFVAEVDGATVSKASNQHLESSVNGFGFRA